MTAADEYERRRAEALAEDARLDPWSAATGHGRVVLVAAAVALLAFTGLAKFGEWRAAYVGLLLLFVALGMVQTRIENRRRLARRRAAHHARGLDRLAGKWKTFPSTGESLAAEDHPYAHDLDVVGAGSLFQLLDTTRTKHGERALGRWLLEAGEVSALDARQKAAGALATEPEFRERLALAGDDELASRIDETAVTAWADGARPFESSLGLRVAAFVLPALFAASIVLAKLSLVAAWIPVVVAFAILGFRRLHRDRTRALGTMAEPAERALSQLLPMLEAALTVPPATPKLEALKAELEGAVEAIRALTTRIVFLQSRANLIVAVVGPFLLWEIHAGLMLDRWHRSHGTKVRGWFQALGELEALSAVATYVREHPDDAFAELSREPAVFEADALGHPLLAADRCVRNDVRLGGTGTVLLVTGSNMSGKSTLLRSCGLAAVMALAGLPVRARRFRVSRLQVATCMRVADSLSEGQSFFLAEVRRLKMVLDLAVGRLPVLFLLDEILQGTNTRERSLGARGIVTRLIDDGGMGLVSTHDLSLVQLVDALKERVTLAHFTDQVDGARMTFDYVMRPGVVQSSNALRVMRANGLAIDVPE